jgi:restriction endonuclease/topoisomerase-like DNA binding C4 zinc finger protein
MKVLAWLEHRLAAARLSIALATPVVVFVLLDLAVQAIVRQFWGSSDFLLWEWQAITIPTLIFIAAYGVTIVAVVAQMRRWGWWRLLESNRSLDAIRSLNWRDFERFVAAAFTEKGWNPEVVGQSGPDGGIDLILRKGKQQALVQCKQRRFASGAYVTEQEVREFAGVVAARKAVKAYLVTSGVFAPEAAEFGEKIPQLELIDGTELLAMVGHCPKCKADLEPKQGKYGLFLSCVRYPECDGAVNLAA